jgi:hypothetical protein
MAASSARAKQLSQFIEKALLVASPLADASESDGHEKCLNCIAKGQGQKVSQPLAFLGFQACLQSVDAGCEVVDPALFNHWERGIEFRGKPRTIRQVGDEAT